MAEEKAVKEAAVVEVVKTSSALPQAPKAGEVKETAKTAPEAVKSEAPKAKEADPGKELVDAIMAEMALKGASKKRLIKTLAEQYGFDKQKVLFKLRRALITERYAAAHAAAEGGAGH